MRFQISQAGCLLFAFCYVWKSPDCVSPRCGQLNRMGQTDFVGYLGIFHFIKLVDFLDCFGL